MSENNQENSQNKNKKQGFVIPTDNDAVRERKKRQEKKLQEEIEKQQDKFTEGETLEFVRVRFPGHAKSYPFLIGNRRFAYGQKVVAMSDRGVAVGYINSFPYTVEFDNSMLPIKNIQKVATQEDIDDDLRTYRKQKETETLCLRLIEKYELDMNLTHVEFTQFGKKVVFYFTAPARVDFRDLVKDLVNELKLRIELRQISVRDRSAAIGGIGPCGRLLCCSSFLDKYGNVNIKMAKNQNLTLTFSKLNGVCGQLKCCLQYENDVYYQRRKGLPEEGSMVETLSGDKGKVLRLHLLSEQFDVLTDRGNIKRYSKNQFKQTLGANYQFPQRFDHISDETSNVIGITEYEAENQRKFARDIERLKKKNNSYINQVYKSLFSDEEYQNLDDQENTSNDDFEDKPEPYYDSTNDFLNDDNDMGFENKNGNDRKEMSSSRSNNYHKGNKDKEQLSNEENRPHRHKKNFNRKKFNKNKKNFNKNNN